MRSDNCCIHGTPHQVQCDQCEAERAERDKAAYSAYVKRPPRTLGRCRHGVPIIEGTFKHECPDCDAEAHGRSTYSPPPSFATTRLKETPSDYVREAYAALDDWRESRGANEGKSYRLGAGTPGDGTTKEDHAKRMKVWHIGIVQDAIAHRCKSAFYKAVVMELLDGDKGKVSPLGMDSQELQQSEIDAIVLDISWRLEFTSGRPTEISANNDHPDSVQAA